MTNIAADVLSSLLDLNDDEILTGWVICYETAQVDDRRNVGYLIAPGDTEWKAMGLLEWVKKMLTDVESDE